MSRTSDFSLFVDKVFFKVHPDSPTYVTGSTGEWSQTNTGLLTSWLLPYKSIPNKQTIKHTSTHPLFLCRDVLEPIPAVNGQMQGTPWTCGPIWHSILVYKILFMYSCNLTFHWRIQSSKSAILLSELRSSHITIPTTINIKCTTP